MKTSFFIYGLKVVPLPAPKWLTSRDKIINCEVLQPTWEHAVRGGNEDLMEWSRHMVIN